MRLAVNKAHHPVTALGPGTRAAIWVQGCSIHCRGCLSHDTWDADPAREVEVGDLLAWIESLPAASVDGVTISGGEPFDQPDALLALVEGLDAWRAELAHEVDLLAFSGYPLRRLEDRHAALLARLDAVIAEPFRRDRPTRLLWRGSSNQRLVPFSALGRRRYGPYLEQEVERPPMQAVVDEAIWYVGVPRAGDLDRLDALLAERGVHQGAVSWRP